MYYFVCYYTYIISSFMQILWHHVYCFENNFTLSKVIEVRSIMSSRSKKVDSHKRPKFIFQILLFPLWAWLILPT